MPIINPQIDEALALSGIIGPRANKKAKQRLLDAVEDLGFNEEELANILVFNVRNSPDENMRYKWAELLFKLRGDLKEDRQEASFQINLLALPEDIQGVLVPR